MQKEKTKFTATLRTVLSRFTSCLQAGNLRLKSPGVPVPLLRESTKAEARNPNVWEVPHLNFKFVSDFEFRI